MAKIKRAGARKQRSTRRKARAMPRFTKAPPELVDTFNSAIANVRGVEMRHMFGYPAAFTNGHMFAGLFQSQMIMRLSAADRQVLARGGAMPFEPMPGRPMREYVTVPATIWSSPPALHEWLSKANAFAGSLPPKKKRR